MSIIDVFLIVLILIGIVVGIYLIISLKNINQSLISLRDNLGDLNEKINPILDNIKIITDNAVTISDETEKRVLDLSSTIQNVRNTVSKLSFSSKHTSGKINPIQDLLSNLTAVSKGLFAFWKKLNN